MLLAEPTFLYPTPGRYPFNEVCEEIVRALEARNWDVPGILVNFRTLGSGGAKYRIVSEIRGIDFKITFVCHDFNGSQSAVGAQELIIPRHHIMVYYGEPSPVYYVYAGANWIADKERWVTTPLKSAGKYKRQPRWYLRYTGDCFCGARGLRHTHVGEGPSQLAYSNENNYEYEPVGDEPIAYDSDEVLERFTQWLQSNLLAWILLTPEAPTKINAFPQTSTPFPAGLPPIFCFGTKDDYLRIMYGQNCTVEPHLRYGMAVGYYSLLAHPVPSNAPKEAYCNFLWCGFGEVQPSTHFDELVIPGLPWLSPAACYVFRVVPTRAEGIYVADNSRYEDWYRRLSRGDEHPGRLSSEELEVAQRARAASLQPITTNPRIVPGQSIVLINRELGLDEIQVVSGPWAT